MKNIFLPALLALACFYAHAQVGSPDPSFGKNGRQLAGSNTNTLAESAIKILPLQGGGFYIVINGDGGTLTGTRTALVGQYTADGIVDTAFGTDGFSVPVPFIATDATLQLDGKIVVVGSGNTYLSYLPKALVVVRYNTDGTLDTTFSGDGIQVTHTLNITTTDQATGVELQGDKIVLSGHSEGGGQFMAARYLPDGSLDNNFGTGGIATTNFPELTYEAYTTGLLIQNDEIVVAGSFQGRFVLTRFNNDGTIDNTFNAAGTPGLLITDLGFSTGDGDITSQADKIVVAGSSTDEFIVARFNYDGSLDNSFNNDGIAATAFTGAAAHDVTMYGNKIVVGGSAGTGFAIARFNDDGSIDNSFSGDGKLITHFTHADSARGLALALQGNQLIVTGQAYFYEVSTQKTHQDFAVAQYNGDGSPDNNFSGDGMMTGYFPNSVGEFFNAVVQSDDKIIAVGRLWDSSLVIRYNKDGSLDSTFDGDAMQVLDRSTAYSVRMQGDKIVVAGVWHTASDAGDVNSLVVSRLNPDGSLDNSFGTNGRVTLELGPLGFVDLSPNALAIQNDKIIVVGTKAYNNGYTDIEAILIARFNWDGSLDQGFSQDGLETLDAGLYSGGTAVALQGDKIVVAGHGGNSDFVVARYNNDGSIDPTFGYLSTDIGQSTIDYPEVIRIENDKIIVAGFSFMLSNPNHMVAVVHYNDDGSLDTGYDGDGKSLSAGLPLDLNAKSFSFDASGKLYVATNQPHSSAVTYPDNIYRFNQDGTSDTNFKIAAPFAIGNTIVNNNRLYALGSFYFHEFNSINTDFTKAVIAAYILENNTTISFTCPPAKSVSTDPNKCPAIVTGIDPVFSPAGTTAAINYSLTGATTAQGTGTASGSTFNNGVTTVTYTGANDASITCSFTVTVQDNEPPVITNPLAHPNMLWPPNHQMKDVEIHYDLSDNCGATATLTVTSNEPQSGNGDGDIPVDWEIINEHYIKLRAERRGNGEGRTYTVTINATDAAGNKSTKTVLVKVPHNAGGKPEISMKVFPNPTNSYFSLTSPNKELERVNIRVYNSMGRIIETITGVSLSRNVNFGANYQPGNYSVEVFNSSFSEKLLLVKLPR